jgi:DNA-directed RNA polymerase specialized sigma24 family protein
MNTDEYASQEETVAAIRALSGADHKKLILISRYWYRWRGEPFQGITSPEDLLQEAFVRTLEDRKSVV